MSQVFAVITLVGVGLYGLSTLFSSSAPTTQAPPTAQGVTFNTQSNTFSGGKSKRHKHKVRLSRRKKH